jgi:hypothetical protein
MCVTRKVRSMWTGRRSARVGLLHHDFVMEQAIQPNKCTMLFMDTDKIYNLLNTTTGSEVELALREYLQEAAERQMLHPASSQDIAYGIAGLLSTAHAQTLSDNDPYMQVMTLAAQLELPEKLQGDATWVELRQKIDRL